VTEPIFHLASPDDWARSTEAYSPSTIEQEGFIHCSTGEQLRKVAHELFGDRNDLILLTISPDALDDETLVFEDPYGLGERFPHIYGPLPTSAVRSTGPYLAHLEEGLWMPERRFDPGWMDRILHPDFSEVGASGRVYSRREIIATPRVEFEAQLPHRDYGLELIDEDVALARYVSLDSYQGVPRYAHRSSIWINTNEGWRLRLHQGTPLGYTVSR
jgi:uncharacterized protein (DUF952 family)